MPVRVLRPASWWPAATAFAVTLALSATVAVAEPGARWLCPGGLVSVTSAGETEAAAICDQAQRARAFLATCGITGRQKLAVTVTSRLVTQAGWKKTGEYDPKLARIKLLPFATFNRQAKPSLGQTAMLPRILHASIAAHEIAHGVFHEHTRHLDLTENVHEYVAYVVQLSTLPEDVQARLRAHNEIKPITNMFMFGFFMMLADPERYALNAWHHFHQPENGCGFLQRVIDRKVHFPPPSD